MRMVSALGASLAPSASSMETVFTAAIYQAQIVVQFQNGTQSFTISLAMIHIKSTIDIITILRLTKNKSVL